MILTLRHSIAWFSLSALLLSASCLVVDSLEAQEEQPLPANTPPRIHEQSAVPQNGSVLIPQGCLLPLAIGTVEEFDVADELTARWFVDDVLLSSSQLPAQGEPLRAGPTYTFEIARHPLGPHAVLVAISDGFADGADLRAAREGKAVVSYEWAIDTSNATDCTALSGTADDSADHL